MFSNGNIGVNVVKIMNKQKHSKVEVPFKPISIYFRIYDLPSGCVNSCSGDKKNIYQKGNNIHARFKQHMSETCT